MRQNGTRHQTSLCYLSPSSVKSRQTLVTTTRRKTINENKTAIHRDIQEGTGQDGVKVSLPSHSLGPEVFFDLVGEPLHPLVQAVPGDGIGGGDVPRLVGDALQTQRCRHLHAAHRVPHVHLVGEEKDGQSTGLDLRIG